MNRSIELTNALDEARNFMKPALRNLKSTERQDETAASVLLESLKDVNVTATIENVFQQAVTHLTQLHAIICAEDAIQTRETALDTGVLAVLYSILDFLVVEGIYPSITPGLGFVAERQKRSLLVNRFCKSFPNLNVIDSVLAPLNKIAFGPVEGLCQNLRDSVLLDLLAANGDFAFSPLRPESVRSSAVARFQKYVDSIATSRLYQTLTLLMRPSAPSWWKGNISRVLAQLPLRPGGVRHAIEFFASYHNVSVTTDGESPASTKGPLLSNDAVGQITKVITSVPSFLSADDWFQQLAPQILELLDDQDGPELSRVAATIITNGVLSKRAFGSPGSIGWILFVEPSHNAVFPLVTETPETSQDDLAVITSDSDLLIHLSRLATLVAHPNPSLTGRLLHRLVLPLWGLSSYSGSVASKDIPSLASLLLGTFLRRCGTVDHLRLLLQNLSWNGPELWQYAVGSQGGICIRRRSAVVHEEPLVDKLSSLDIRTTSLVDVLSQSDLPSELIDEFFLQQTKQILLDKKQRPQSSTTDSLLNLEKDPFIQLARVQLVQKMISKFGGSLVASNWQILELVDQSLKNVLAHINTFEKQRNMHNQINLKDLSSIVQNDELGVTSSRSDNETWMDDTIALCIGILTNLAQTNSSEIDPQSQNRLESICKSVDTLLLQRSQALSNPTLQALRMSQHQLQPGLLTSKFNENHVPESKSKQLHLDTISSSLSSTLAPERVKAITEIDGYILDQSTYIDVPSVSAILLKVVEDDTDEFVFLAAIKAFQQLAILKNAGFVMRTLALAFQDSSQKVTLDGRLRIGEALATVTESILQHSDESHATTITNLQSDVKLIIEICLSVASRRGVRSKETDDRNKEARLDKMRQKQAERAWGGEVPDLEVLDNDEVDDPEEKAKELQWIEMTQRIISTWQGNTNAEDIRVRTSTISILSVLVEFAGKLLDKNTLIIAVDLVLAILTVESGEGKAIIRRAAVLVIMAHLRAVDQAREQKLSITDIDGSKWLEIERLLQKLQNIDEDDIVREHVQAVIESMEALRMKQIQDLHNDSTHVNPDTLELNQLRGLTVKPQLSEISKKPGNRIEILD